jgi:hypothetical protein
MFSLSFFFDTEFGLRAIAWVSLRRFHSGCFEELALSILMRKTLLHRR